MAMAVIMKDEVVSILAALASASAESTLAANPAPGGEFLRGYHAALAAVALALGYSVERLALPGARP